jgi:hypothetical protein
MILPMPSVQGPPVNSMMRAAQLPGGTLAAIKASATCSAVPVQRVGRSLLSTGYASRCRSAHSDTHHSTAQHGGCVVCQLTD